MKKLLLLGLILAICILAFPQGVLADTTAGVTVNANFANFLCLTASGPSTWTLDYSQLGYVNTIPAASGIKLYPDANQAWKITVYSAAHGGKFYSTTASDTLNNLLQIENSDAGGTFVNVGTTATTAPLIASDTLGTFSKQRALQQVLDITHDVAEPDYSITLTFDIAPNL
jgi:hypothetical protein